jgi:N,N'-diacetyllegionaminate synthase
MIIGKADTSKKVFIIAEIGNNHEGDFQIAERLITEAAGAGADAVKFQTIVPEKLVVRSDKARIEHLRKFQFSRGQFEKLKLRADAEGILFLSTPFDLESAAWLNDLVPAFKVASGDNTFYPLLDFLADTGKPLLVSTGLLGRTGSENLRDYLETAWNRLKGPHPELALLHCVVSYPTADDDANLGAISHLASMPQVTAGYSDHTLGIDAAVLAVALGARIVEKHFTLDKSQTTFRDHQLSADPNDLRALIAGARKAERLLSGDGLASRPCEVAATQSVRRSIAAGRNLPTGHEVLFSDLVWVRPGTGFPAGEEKRVLNRRLRVSVQAGELFEERHF